MPPPTSPVLSSLNPARTRGRILLLLAVLFTAAEGVYFPGLPLPRAEVICDQIAMALVVLGAVDVIVHTPRVAKRVKLDGLVGVAAFVVLFELIHLTIIYLGYSDPSMEAPCRCLFFTGLWAVGMLALMSCVVQEDTLQWVGPGRDDTPLAGSPPSR